MIACFHGGVRSKKLVAGSLVALALAGAGTAVAGSRHQTVRARAAQPVLPIVDSALAYLQLDRATVLARLRSGESLAQIARAQGKTAGGLVDAIVAAAKAKLDARVAAGALTAAQARAFLAAFEQQVTRIVNTTAHRVERTLPAAAILRPALDYLGLDARTVLVKLRAGQSLAQIARAQGKSADGLVQVVVGAVRKQLDARVTAGKLTAAQEQLLLALLRSQVTRLVGD